MSTVTKDVKNKLEKKKKQIPYGCVDVSCKDNSHALDLPIGMFVKI